MNAKNPNLPDTSEPLTAPFWDAARNHILVAQSCADCGDMRYPALEICPQCWSADQTWAPIATTGTLWSYVVYHRALDPSKKDDVPYVIGRVKTEDGPVFTVRLDVSPDEAEVGMPLIVSWDDVDEEVTLVRFAPR